MLTSPHLINHYIDHPPPFPIYALVQIQKCLNPVIFSPFSTLSFVQGQKGEWACFKVSHVTEVRSSRELFYIFSCRGNTRSEGGLIRRSPWNPINFHPHTQMSYYRGNVWFKTPLQTEPKTLMIMCIKLGKNMTYW